MRKIVFRFYTKHYMTYLMFTVQRHINYYQMLHICRIFNYIVFNL